MGSAVAIIPARGGSKSVPRKNVLPLCGKPLIGWTIEAALGAQSVDRVVVSTDDAEIANTSERFGAQVVWRPLEISGDSASSESALLHALDHLAQCQAYRPQTLAFLQCTSPLTASEDVDGTVNALYANNADSALAVANFHYFLWRRQADGSCEGINHDKSVRLLRQQREPQFIETGAVYAMRVEGFLKAKHRFFGTTAMYTMPIERTLEIDEPVHLRIAEMILRERETQQRMQRLPERIGALVFDFDGVFTDNRVLVFDDGREAVLCSRGDGMSFDLLRPLGIPALVLSKEQNPVVAARCRKLNLEYRQGIDDKKPALLQWLAEKGVAAGDVIYLGNDVNDLECLQMVGCPVVVNDAHPQAKEAAGIVLECAGGFGAIRELAELILRLSGRAPAAE